MPASPAVAGFCCAGCATVFQLLRDGGLDRFYTLGGGAGQPVGAAPRAADMPWLEELAAQGRGPDGVVRIALDVQGIRCAACVWVLQELWRRQPGTLGIDIDPSVGRMALAWREAAEDTPREEPPLAGPTAERPAAGLSLATVRQILQGAARLGYPVGPATKDRAPRDRSLMVRLGVCSALAMNAMILAISVYAGLEDEGGMLAELFGWVSAGLATAAVVVGGPVFFRGAVQGLRQRVWHLDLPIALGISLAWAGSVWAFSAGQPAYFDSVTVFVALMVAGRFVQERAVARNRDRLLRDDGAEHLRVRRVEDGRIDVVPVRDLQAGDELVLAPGDLVPVEVLLDQDEAAFSLDWISGEAEPRRFERGGRIPAGAFQGGRAPVRAVAAEGFETSHLRQLLRVPQGDPDDVRGRGGFWRQVNRTYVIAVLGLAAIGLLAWWPVDPYRAVSVAVAILVVTCPCALGLAMPLGFHLALADLRRHGVFVRTTALLEKARHVRKVLFDKTGTLTWGGLRVTSAAMPAAPLTAGERAAVRSMVALSNHPASLAVGQWLAAEGSGAGAPEGRPAATVLASGGPGDDALTVVENPGAGLEAHLGAHVYRLGRRGFAAAADAEAAVEGPAAARADEGDLWLQIDGEARAVFALAEDDRPGIEDELRSLAALGLEVHMMSGDRVERVARAAARMGLPPERAHGGLSPEDKAQRVAAIDRDDTLMVGDGINDAPAFEAAYCAGTPALDRPVLPGRADFFYTGAQPGAVLGVLSTARRLHKTVVANLWLAGLYNAAALVLCFAGVMTPLLCAVLMPMSSLLLLGHTYVRFGRSLPRQDSLPQQGGGSR